jgi:hypothetical protein
MPALDRLRPSRSRRERGDGGCKEEEKGGEEAAREIDRKASQFHCPDISGLPLKEELSRRRRSVLTCPEMKKVLSMLASIGAGGWRESAGTEAVEVV